jgi:hypothetical protein
VPLPGLVLPHSPNDRDGSTTRHTFDLTHLAPTPFGDLCRFDAQSNRADPISNLGHPLSEILSRMVRIRKNHARTRQSVSPRIVLSLTHLQSMYENDNRRARDRPSGEHAPRESDMVEQDERRSQANDRQPDLGGESYPAAAGEHLSGSFSGRVDVFFSIEVQNAVNRANTTRPDCFIQCADDRPTHAGNSTV